MPQPKHGQGAPGATLRNRPQPDISLIVPCYNAAETVADTLDSIRAQTHENWEAVCLDDGSTDATPDLLQRYADDDPRIGWHSLPHAGLAATRNRGVPLARAERILFLDADDVVRPAALTVLLAAATAAGPRHILAAACELLDEHGHPLSLFRFPVIRDFSVDIFLRGNQLTPMTLIPKSVLGPRPFDETLRACEDWDLWLRLADAGVRCATLPRALFGYRLRASSLSRKPDLMFATGRRVIERWLPRAREPERARDALHRLACTYGAVALAAGTRDALQRYFTDLPPLDPTEDFHSAVAGSIHGAFTLVHGATGATWPDNTAVWLAQIEPWLHQGPLAAHAETILARLEHILATPRDYAALVQDFLTRTDNAERLLIYGLGWNGVALLEQLRRDGRAGSPELCVADDRADALTFTVVGLPREDPRTWPRWPDGTVAVVTPNAPAAMVQTLQKAGGQPGIDFITLAECAAACGSTSFA